MGAADDNLLEAVLVVYIERGAEPAASHVPDQVGGVRIKRVFTDPFVAVPACNSCGNSAAGNCK